MRELNGLLDQQTYTIKTIETQLNQYKSEYTILSQTKQEVVKEIV